ncbi:MAG TPA: DUF3618 domain-containing protein [Gemmatimonadaceae bacterium]|nr:DUF3618 domain-containing protein [Gemmatimonadaceae bacterium]
MRRDIELTRERISSTLAQLEQKTNVVQIVKDHPWPALAVAFGAGVLLSGSSADVKAAAATATATRGASGKLGTLLDDVVANLMGGVHQAFQGRVDSLVNELKLAIGAPTTTTTTTTGNGAASLAGNGSNGGASWAPQSASTDQASSSGLGTGAAATPPASTPNAAGAAGQGYQPTRAD